MLEPIQYLLGGISGLLVGLLLSMFGGGGSIVAVPLMVYVVGVKVPHMAIGTSALAVATNAATSLIGHARIGTVKWQCAGLFSTAGMLGAYAGSSFGKVVDGEQLLALFALLMLVVGTLMLLNRRLPDREFVTCTGDRLFGILLSGLCVGAVSGFFGIGGGFLIVPALIAATGMPILNAIGSSLLAVTTFGLTTAVNYTASGLIDWPLAGAFIIGGIAGGFFGKRIAVRLAIRRGTLNTLFAVLIYIVAIYMLTAHLVPKMR
ncbi:sulfite exporter TauE/SafE family protein [Brucella anthropi]|uniref:Probable membrane transporter protein n=1 Tax=Brucella intermedia GD04153 TaxID=2975438 RepID=A0AA42H1Y9_9HYPH|nr:MULTISPECIES: sulfite exporter TauE/SafE family protein [Brucella]MDH0126840.1 sulfite exporter TauE/SafE family protein [Brucella intermedia GD04153]MDH0369635.1 sulfite exporter TauE/SafE family protein [Brucella anthropi]RRD22000.1 sulfite exporter TauE/SafE family protein [Brucellaceae bacterium VT-16-1752]